ncbi:MAG: hypothetical protein ACOC9P_01095 [bacterium]
MTLHWVPILPLWAVGVLTLGLLALLLHGAVALRRKRVEMHWVGLLSLLRLAAIVALVLCAFHPILRFVYTTETDENLLVLIDRSASMKHKQVASLDDLRASLEEQFNLTSYAIDRRAQPIADESWSALPAEGESTDLAAGILSALEQYALDQVQAPTDRPSRIVLISDRMDHGATDPVRAAIEHGLTVDVVAPTASETPGATLLSRIANVQAPQRIRLGSQLRIMATLLVPGRGNGETYALELLEDGEILRSTTVTSSAGSTVIPVTLDHQPTSPGPHRYALRLRDPAATMKPDGTKDAEQNPTLRLAVHVDTSQREVLLLEGTRRWSFRFIRRVIEDDPQFNFTAFRSRGDGAWMQFSEPGQRNALSGLPERYADLNGFDVFIIGDIDPRDVPDSMLKSIRYLVAEEGRSLAVIAGRDVGRLATAPGWSTLLPVELEANPKVRGPSDVQLSEEAADMPAFFRPDDGGAALWSNLPPIEHVYTPSRKKPGASVLIESAEMRNAFGPLIVAASHPVGRGHVLFIATDTLWRWHMLGPMTKTGLTPYAVFWQQALRAITLDRPRATRDMPAIHIQPRRTISQVDETIDLDVTFDDGSGEAPSQSPELHGSASFADGTIVPLVLTPDAAQAGRYHAQVSAIAEGPCTIRISENRTEQKSAAVQAVIDIQPKASEVQDTGIDVAALMRLARETGGRWIDMQDQATWPEPNTARRETVQRISVFDPWQNYALLLLVAVLLGADWLLRAIRGYT